jgi:hypothetical protein
VGEDVKCENEKLRRMATTVNVIVLPEGEWRKIISGQEEIIRLLQQLPVNLSATRQVSYMTAIEFMEAVRIKRTKFDELVAANKIKILKKGRKIYVPVEEVERYFREG